MDRSLRALNRFGLGARIGERESIGDPADWLRSQLNPDAARLAGAASLPTAGEIAEAIGQLGAAARAGDAGERAAAQRRITQIAAREGSASLGRRVTTTAPFVERLVAFWSNHLCVSALGKPQVAPLAGLYEREVIRPHVLGRYEEMVLASARHPAMLLYLDNARSIGPGSRAGRSTARRGEGRGLNENYARELLELHTVGVNGGYEQADVEQLARILTGWSVEGVRPRDGDGGPPGFRFRPEIHEPGDKTVLGIRYQASGEAEGESVIRDLCRKPATADYLAGKLARHFVSDSPPAAAVDAIANAWRASDGDLKEVSLVLIDLESAWDPDARKFRTPQDWLVAVLRAVNATDVHPRLGFVLRELRHPLWRPPAPKGFGDTTAEWADPDSLLNRAELARSVASRVAEASVDPRNFLGTVDTGDSGLLQSILEDGAISSSERVALAIGGPAFQWR
jgi:uncharacterized protein (DUF1800 family)